MKTIKYLRYLGAVKINAVARGRLARRQYQTEKALKILSTCHPLLIKYSLRSKTGEKRVFWYKRELEVKLLFTNYLLLIDKTGNHPPRLLVERNVQEIARRILSRKNELVVLIQKRWRGFLARRIVKYFKTEISRMFSLSVAKVIRIQQLFRGHFVRVNLRKILFLRFKEEKMKSYLNERHLQSLLSAKESSKELSLISYRKDYQIEKTGRFISKLPYGSEYNKDDSEYDKTNDYPYGQKKYKLEIYTSSIHSDNQTMEFLKEDLIHNSELMKNENSFIYEDIWRKQFILNRIDEKGPLGYGSRSGEGRYGFIFINEPSIPFSSSSALLPWNNNNNANRDPIESSLVPSQSSSSSSATSSSAVSVSKKGKKTNLLKAKETTRQQSMRYYFQKDLNDIAQRVIERVNKGQPPLGNVDHSLVDKTIEKMKKLHFSTEKEKLSSYERNYIQLKKEEDRNLRLSIISTRTSLQMSSSLLSNPGSTVTSARGEKEKDKNNPFSRALVAIQDIDFEEEEDEDQEKTGGILHIHNMSRGKGESGNARGWSNLSDYGSFAGDSSINSDFSYQQQHQPPERYNARSLKLLNDFRAYNRERLKPAPQLPVEGLPLLLLDHNNHGGSGNNSRRGSSQPSSRKNSRQPNRLKPSSRKPSSESLLPSQLPPPVNKGYQFPKDINFNSTNWLFSNEEC
jgi:hypothetical protein